VGEKSWHSQCLRQGATFTIVMSCTVQRVPVF
jgi:hypothetical protein